MVLHRQSHDPRRLGQDVLAFARTLADEPDSPDKRVIRAKEHIPVSALREMDADRNKAERLFATCASPPETAQVMYLFARPLFDAAREQNLSGWIFQGAGKLVGESLTAMGDGWLDHQEYKWVPWAAENLIEVGHEIKDEWFVAVGRLFGGFDLYGRGNYPKAWVLFAAVLETLPEALMQRADDPPAADYLKMAAAEAKEIMDDMG